MPLYAAIRFSKVRKKLYVIMLDDAIPAGAKLY